MDATLFVYTFKEGLLSKLAHDLRFSVSRFHVTVRGTAISARIELGSLRVDGVVRHGRLERTEPAPSDREKIHENLAKDVLQTREYPEARFQGRLASTSSPFRVEGQLTLKGETRPLSFLLNARDQRLVGELELTPSQWQIKPYRALGGTLKVQDRVRIAIDASADWMAQGHELNPAIELVWTPRASRGSLKPS